MIDGIIIAQKTLQFLRDLADEEKKNKIITGIVVFVVIFIFVLALPIYLIISPLTVLADIVKGDIGAIELIKDLKSEYGFEYVLEDEREIPLFFQFDERWANYPYAGTTIKVAGCGPSSLAMVVAGLTGDSSITPQTMAEFSESRGWAIAGVGTSWELMTTGAREFGLNAEQISTSAESIVSQLSQGKPIIASMSAGTFTTGGHFIVLTGLTDEGKIKVNDSWSEENSNCVFSPELISSECKGAWAYSLDIEIIEE